jgi:hypothetical protein
LRSPESIEQDAWEPTAVLKLAFVPNIIARSPTAVLLLPFVEHRDRRPIAVLKVGVPAEAME